MSIKNYTVAYSTDCKNIELIKIQKETQANLNSFETVNVVTDSYDVTDQVLKVVALYLQATGLKNVLTEHGILSVNDYK